MVARLVARSLLPPLLLIVSVGIVAAAVEHYLGAAPARMGKGYGNPVIRTGELSYPREAIDSDSYVVRVAKPARRIVSQYWSIDETVYSVVPPERVVAVSETGYLGAFTNIAKYTKQYRPTVATDAERVLRLNPDLLMVSNSSRVDFCALIRNAGLPIDRVFTDFTTLQQLADTIRLTGYLTGEDAKASAEIADFWRVINLAKARRPASAPHPRVLGVGGHSSYGKRTLFNDVITTLGGVNVGAEGGLQTYDRVSDEQIIRWNPEWIIAGAEAGKEKQVLASLQKDVAISTTQAARNRHIVVLDYRVFLPMSPYTKFMVAAVAGFLYGDGGLGSLTLPAQNGVRR